MLCYPVGVEYVRSHWAFRQLAGHLAGKGYHVFRFDYYGTGDSAGEFEQADISCWLENIELAAAEFRHMANWQQLSLVGLRLGATLGLLASERLALNQLVMWDPVIDGKAYINTLAEMHETLKSNPDYIPAGSRGSFHFRDDEMIGYIFNAQLRDQIRALDLSKAQPERINQTTLITTGNHASVASLAGELSERCGSIGHESINGDMTLDLVGEIDEAYLPANSIQFINGIFD